jgi:hypothetical protein
MYVMLLCAYFDKYPEHFTERITLKTHERDKNNNHIN